MREKLKGFVDINKTIAELKEVNGKFDELAHMFFDGKDKGIIATLRGQIAIPKCEVVDGGVMVGTQFVAARDRIEIAEFLMGRK